MRLIQCSSTQKHYQAGRPNFEVGMKRGSAKYTERLKLLFNSCDLLLPLISVKMPLQQISTALPRRNLRFHRPQRDKLGHRGW